MCKICGKAFTTKEYLKLHKSTIHEERKAFPCKICGKDFGRGKPFAPSFRNIFMHRNTVVFQTVNVKEFYGTLFTFVNKT